MDHDPSGNKFNVLPRIQHPGQVVYGCVRVGTSHAFDKRGDGVIVVIPVLAIADGPLLDTLLGRGQVDMYFPVLIPVRGQDPQLHRV